MYCKVCGKEGHYALECLNRGSVSVYGGGSEGGDDGGAVDPVVEGPKVGIKHGGVGGVPERVTKWKAGHREEYKRYMREYMRRKRGG